MPDHSSPVLFVHIPKTGGTSLWEALRRAYGSPAVLRIDERPPALNEARMAELIATGEDQRYRLVGGHVFFDPDRDYPYMTVLRDPVERLLSGYFYALQSSSHPLYESLSAVGIEEGLRLLSPDIHVRYLAGVPRDRDPTPADLETAKRNLETRFQFVGLLERFHESLILLRLTFGGRLPYYIRRNTGKNRPRQIDPAVREVAHDHNQLDRALYDYATELFEARIRQAGATFSRDLAFFERTLPLWGQAYSVRARLLRRLSR